MTENELMGKVKISTAVSKMAIPSIISSLVTVVYNMADTFFVGQTNDALQVAAVSLTNPIFILFMAFSNMLGMGASAVASIAMGEHNHERMKKTSSFITYASLVLGAAAAIILLLFMRPILALFGADAQTYSCPSVTHCPRRYSLSCVRGFCSYRCSTCWTPSLASAASSARSL